MSVCLIFFSFLLIFLIPVTSFAKEPPVLTLSENGRVDFSPVTTYIFKIYGDGTVYYRGESNVNVIGERHAKITPHQVQQLIATYKAIDALFKKYKAESEERYTALTHCRSCLEIFRLQYQGEVSELRPGGFSRDMFVNLNKMTPIRRWLCFDKGDPWKCPVESRVEPANLYPID